MKVILIAALSADGFIARNTDELADWTGSEDKKLFVELTKRAGVMVMGRTTFETIGRALPGRQTIVYSHRPLEIPGVTVTDESPTDLVQRLAATGQQELAICGGAAVYTQFMQAGVVDELYLTVVPCLFGGGVTLFSQPLESSLRLLETRSLSDDVITLHYEVQK
nr:RibD C-terminal domain protein [uncultured bacterium]AIA15224.1 RibD C-terminal domain protein [uncultured bacterium]